MTINELPFQYLQRAAFYDQLDPPMRTAVLEQRDRELEDFLGRIFGGGADGIGTTILNGTGPPADSLGEPGDYYEDTLNGVLYGPKAAGSMATGAILNEPFNTLDAWTKNSTPTVVAGRNGTAAQVSGVSQRLMYAIPAGVQNAVVMVGAAVRVASLSAQQTIFGLRSDTGATNHGAVSVSTAGAVFASNAAGSSAGASPNGTIVANTWYYIEVKYTLGDTPNGAVILRVNGNQVVNVTGIDTKAGGTKTVYDEVRLGPPNASSGGTVQYDDLYVKVGAGATFEGDIVIGGTIWPVAVRRLPYVYQSSGGITTIAAKTGQRVQFVTVPDAGTPETWIADVGANRFQVGDVVVGLHPAIGINAIWMNSAPGSGDYWVAKSTNDLLVNAAASGTVRLRRGNVDAAYFGPTDNSMRIKTAVDTASADQTWGNAHLLLYSSSTDNPVRLAAQSPGVAPQLRVQATVGDRWSCIGSTGGYWVPIGASAFEVNSTITAKRGVRSLHPERERAVVRHDPQSDTAPCPDIMALRPVAFRPKRPAMRIVPTNGDSYDYRNPDSWTYAPATGIHGIEGNRERLGLIAEEVQHVVPSAVNHDADGNALGIDYAQVTVALLDHVQRLTDEVATLRYRIAELEGQP